MENKFKLLSNGERWKILVNKARHTVEGVGYEMQRVPGKGRSNVWELHKGNKKTIAAIRTTQDRYIAFLPLEEKWKTLGDVDTVIVAAVDDIENPQNVEVYMFPADEVQKRFDEAYYARVKAGYKINEDVGMWVCLDPIDHDSLNGVGTGILRDHKPIAVLPLDDPGGGASPAVTGDQSWSNQCETISDIITAARRRIAQISGMPEQSIQLELRIGG